MYLQYGTIQEQIFGEGSKSQYRVSWQRTPRHDKLELFWDPWKKLARETLGYWSKGVVELITAAHRRFRFFHSKKFFFKSIHLYVYTGRCHLGKQIRLNWHLKKTTEKVVVFFFYWRKKHPVRGVVRSQWFIWAESLQAAVSLGLTVREEEWQAGGASSCRSSTIKQRNMSSPRTGKSESYSESISWPCCYTSSGELQNLAPLIY